MDRLKLGTGMLERVKNRILLRRVVEQLFAIEREEQKLKDYRKCLEELERGDYYISELMITDELLRMGKYEKEEV